MQVLCVDAAYVVPNTANDHAHTLRLGLFEGKKKHQIMYQTFSSYNQHSLLAEWLLTDHCIYLPLRYCVCVFLLLPMVSLVCFVHKMNENVFKMLKLFKMSMSRKVALVA